MKLLVITAVAEFTSDIKQLLKEAGINSFSYREVTGHSGQATGSPFDNWFGSNVTDADSILFYAFAENLVAEKAFEHFSKYNNQLESKSVIHLASINIDKIL